MRVPLQRPLLQLPRAASPPTGAVAVSPGEPRVRGCNGLQGLLGESAVPAEGTGTKRGRGKVRGAGRQSRWDRGSGVCGRGLARTDGAKDGHEMTSGRTGKRGRKAGGGRRARCGARRATRGRQRRASRLRECGGLRGLPAPRWNRWHRQRLPIRARLPRRAQLERRPARKKCRTRWRWRKRGDEQPCAWGAGWVATAGDGVTNVLLREDRVDGHARNARPCSSEPAPSP